MTLFMVRKEERLRLGMLKEKKKLRLKLRLTEEAYCSGGVDCGSWRKPRVGFVGFGRSRPR